VPQAAAQSFGTAIVVMVHTLEEDGDDVERVAVFVIGVRVGAEAKEDAAQYVREEDDI
jgi:hypothetical protein